MPPERPLPEEITQPSKKEKKEAPEFEFTKGTKVWIEDEHGIWHRGEVFATVSNSIGVKWREEGARVDSDEYVDEAELISQQKEYMMREAKQMITTAQPAWVKRNSGELQEGRVMRVVPDPISKEIRVTVGWEDEQSETGMSGKALELTKFMRIQKEVRKELAEQLINKKIWIKRRDGTWNEGMVVDLVDNDEYVFVRWSDAKTKRLSDKKVEIAELLAWQEEKRS